MEELNKRTPSFFIAFLPCGRSASAVNSCRRAAGVNSRRRAAGVNSRGSLRFAPLCTHTEHSLLAVAALRSALHSYRTFTTRGLYFVDRCGACPHWAIRVGRCASLRSALIPNIHYSRSLCGVALILLTGAALTVMYCKFGAWRNTARGRPLSQDVPLLKKAPLGLFLINPRHEGLSLGVFRALRSAAKGSSRLRLGRRFSAAGTAHYALR